jgi:putative transposase
MVAFAERFVQTIKQECLDHFVVFSHKHMDLLCQEFKDCYHDYHEERPHQGLENELVIDGMRTKKRSKITLLDAI